MTVKGVIFDIGGVVVSLDFPGMFARIAARSTEPLEVIRGEFWPERGPNGASHETTLARATCGDLTREEILNTVHQRIGFLGDTAELDQLYSTLFPSRIEGTIALMTELAKGYRVGIISNISAWSWPHASRLVPELTEIEHSFLSFQEKLVKPDPALFLRAAEKMELETADQELKILAGGAARARILAGRLLMDKDAGKDKLFGAFTDKEKSQILGAEKSATTSKALAQVTESQLRLGLTGAYTMLLQQNIDISPKEMASFLMKPAK